MTDTSDAVETNAQGPKSASGDGQSVSQHSLTEQIKADRYTRAATAVTKPRWGLRFAKLRPPGGDS